jgi:eukaryotic-like serine/threonine-protein kinase
MTCTTCNGDLEANVLFCGYCGRRTRVRRDAAIGSVIDETYRLDEKLAEGGFGAIYRATHLASGSALALKILHADFAADSQLAGRFLRESKALARLRNPHTVVTYERGEARDGTLYIAMELLRGESLLQRFTRLGPLAWPEVLAIMRAVASSLREAHELGIVHRDLKPANIHLDGGVKVLDFGVAKLLPWSGMDDGNELTLTGQAVGTLEYMAPEQLCGSACDARTDIFALGVVAYEMITGRRPFAEARNAPSLITALFTQTAAPPSQFANAPAHVDELLLRCLERDAADRFANVVELADAIDRILVARPTPRTNDIPSRSCGSLQMIEPRRHAIAPTVAYALPAPQLRPSAMPSFEVEVRGTAIDAKPYRAPRWWLWIAGVVIALAAIAIISSGA